MEGAEGAEDRVGVGAGVGAGAGACQNFVNEAAAATEPSAVFPAPCVTPDRTATILPGAAARGRFVLDQATAVGVV